MIEQVSEQVIEHVIKFAKNKGHNLLNVKSEVLQLCAFEITFIISLNHDVFPIG